MALYSDGPPATIEDLSAYDSQLLDVASTEGIDVTKKLALAQDELGMELRVLLNRLTPAGGCFATQPKLSFESIVVTPPLRLWYINHVLKLVYSDAYYNQSNDRYAHKRDQFEEEARRAYETLIETGLGIAHNPLPLAPTPTVTAVGGSLPAGTYYITASWVNAAGEEGSPAVPASLSVVNQTIFAQIGPAPGNATGWNIYIGTDPDILFRQNAVPIPVQNTWLQSGALLTSSARPGRGQVASFFQPVPRFIQRG
jgi:hypothetical protein